MSECLDNTPVMENKHAVMLTALQVTRRSCLQSLASNEMLSDRRKRTEHILCILTQNAYANVLIMPYIHLIVPLF